MNHKKNLRKFSRTPSHRRAMFRNLATSLLEHEKIQTTVYKAKDLRRVAEKLITLAKTDNVQRRRKAYGYLKSKAVVHKLFAELGPRFEKRAGGYTRVIKLGQRFSDAADMALIELVQDPKTEAKKESKSEEKKPAKATKAKAEEKPTEAKVEEKKPAKAKAKKSDKE
ncbi:UNVERIFIED_CONTAM: hypothetical protein GTU68_056333 [Idotea baltica]|nr:hypothetical protein [Idotea baltica]